ncbi:hypothetical protein PsorP6_011868 [Peronosclerospora sorghi]|uniref:Uncharacterized protein n=1 Tax=Peronosclerospora sorghi TaxID=230839 RepID=A0ACC0WKE1_9STRA|nr:hypothetical protein PsorP6_011868 [Peronosclerospora sorghi]
MIRVSISPRTLAVTSQAHTGGKVRERDPSSSYHVNSEQPPATDFANGPTIKASPHVNTTEKPSETFDFSDTMAATPPVANTEPASSPVVTTTNISELESTSPSPSSPSSSSSLSGGAIAGIAVGVACLAFVLAAFVVVRKRVKKQQQPRFSLSKCPASSTFGDSCAVPLGSSKLAPPGVFGRLHSHRHKTEAPDMTSVFSLKGDEQDPFMRRTVAPSGKIWDDPVLLAARIPYDQLALERRIARGGFGEVYLASFKGQPVAVKTLLPETSEDLEEIQALFTETKVLAQLAHPCIVQFIGIAWESIQSVACVTEYLVGGDLRSLLNHFVATPTHPRGFDHDKVKIALDIAHGLTYLHALEPCLLHRDLKSRNVLLTSQLNAKLTDFGVSRERSDGMMTNAVGTSLWMAPEVMLGHHYDGKADMFSFGVLLSELDTHLMPYANVRNANGRKLGEATILKRVAAGDLRVEFSRECHANVLALARACLALDPTDRPTAAEACTTLQEAITLFDVEEVAI